MYATLMHWYMYMYNAAVREMQFMTKHKINITYHLSNHKTMLKIVKRHFIVMFIDFE